MDVKNSSPVHHLQKPDTDKLIRAILDALTGIIYKDDSQVDAIHVTKKWADTLEPAGVFIMIETDPREAT